jgi:DNA ligase-1
MSEDDEGEAGGATTIEDGDSVEVQGSSSTYTLTRHGSVYMCSCPAWKNQGAPVDLRTCKHLRAYLGEEAETKRLGALPSRAASTKSSGGGSSANKKETAPPVLLAHKWEIEHDPTGWWMSEKLDGIRAYWDGETFVSRLGNRFFAPDWFVEDLPADTLDGELWVGRKMFQKTTSIVRSGAAGQEWKTVQYVVFDAPNAKGGFEDRVAHAQKVLARSGAPHARWHEHVQCDGMDHLREELARVEALGGEGLMLRQPRSKYDVGRSRSLLKVKTFHDAEATVVGHAPGTGKHKGRLGALIVELPGGIRFNVGTGFSDAEREAPPKLGAVITFRYQELSDDGVPRFPSWVGERLDVATPAPIGKSSRPIATVPLAKGTGSASTSTTRTSAPETRAEPKPVKAAKPKPPTAPKPAPEPADDEAEDEAEADESDGDAENPMLAKYGPVAFTCKLVNKDEGKFWEIEVRGKAHFTKFGKIGSTGQMRLTEIGSATAAKTDAEKRAMLKRREGYR